VSRTFTASYKAEIVAKYEALDRAGKGALLRQEGLYTSLVGKWRAQRDKGALAGLASPSGRPAGDERDRQILKLRKEKECLEAELGTARKVIDIQGKLSVLLDQLVTDSVSTGNEPTP
jgi:transposase-like protein